MATATSYTKTQLDTILSSKAPLASPTFTGTPIVPTATAGTSTTQAASTAFVAAAVAALVAASPAALDTLKELADALGDDPNFATTMTNALAGKAPLASPTFTGTVAGITATMVGLGNVNNTADSSKPVSAAQASADTAAKAQGVSQFGSGLAEFGAQAWTVHPDLATANTAATSGTLLGTKVHVGIAGTPANAILNQASVPTTTTLFRVGIYAADGTQIGTTADASASMTAIGGKTLPLTMTRALVVDETIYICALWVGTGTFGIYNSVSAAAANLGLSASQAAMYANFGIAAQADLPTTLPFTSAAGGTSKRLIVLK